MGVSFEQPLTTGEITGLGVLNLLEAMACGIPVIVSDRASLPEVVGDAGILVEAMDAEAITGQMQRLIDDSGFHRQQSEAGLQCARQFTWRRCALQTMAVYATVLRQA